MCHWVRPKSPPKEIVYDNLISSTKELSRPGSKSDMEQRDSSDRKLPEYVGFKEGIDICQSFLKKEDSVRAQGRAVYGCMKKAI